jgi:hypothetical protein
MQEANNDNALTYYLPFLNTSPSCAAYGLQRIYSGLLRVSVDKPWYLPCYSALRRH